MGSSVNPEMIVLARESRGLTQIDLAEMVSLAQGEISRYENGTRNISDEHLQRIANVLGYPVAFFYHSGQRYGLGSSGLHHRKRKTLPARTLDLFIAKINILRFVLDRLMDSVEIEHVQKFPQYDVDEFRGDIEHIAELVRAAWKLPSGPIVDFIGVLEQAGAIVHRINFETQKIDALVQWVPPNPPIILINETSPGDRLRFTLAHELGHLIMHDTPRENMEEEADRFAAAFLMPARDTLPYFGHVTLQRLAQLKPYWRVSIAALIRRARDLDAISDRQYRSLNEEMSKLGYRIHEPVPIPIEKPTLYKEIIDAYLGELNFSVAEIAELVALDEQDFRQQYFPQNTVLRLVPSHTKSSGNAI
jgi:Zn-dependent peptidase ImmA (M78 family)/plasmid maintenance system antidote protein VapI